MKFIVLGGYGIIGKVVVLDLFKTCKNCEIIVAGRDLKKAQECVSSYKSSRVKAAKVDIKDINQTAKLLKDSDVAVNCVQYYFNLQIMKACIKAKTNYVDLGGLFHMTKKTAKASFKIQKNQQAGDSRMRRHSRNHKCSCSIWCISSQKI